MGEVEGFPHLLASKWRGTGANGGFPACRRRNRGEWGGGGVPPLAGVEIEGNGEVEGFPHLLALKSRGTGRWIPSPLALKSRGTEANGGIPTCWRQNRGKRGRWASLTCWHRNRGEWVSSCPSSSPLQLQLVVVGVVVVLLVLSPLAAAALFPTSPSRFPTSPSRCSIPPSSSRCRRGAAAAAVVAVDSCSCSRCCRFRGRRGQREGG